MDNQTPNEIKTIIKDWTNEQINEVYTALPGKVIDYNPKVNRARVRPTGKYKTDDGRDFEYPDIYNAPCYFPMGMCGKAGITFPIKGGDGCLIVFSKEQMTDWLSNYESDLDDPRSHSINDAIVLPGLYSAAVPSNMEHSEDVCIFLGNALLQLNDSEFKGEVAGTNFRFADGDLVVNGISLVHHTHGGIYRGGSNTNEPS